MTLLPTLLKVFAITVSFLSPFLSVARTETIDGIVVNLSPLAIDTDATLPVALTEVSYWQPIEASGGEEPYTWEIVDPDNAPEWLYVSAGDDDNESHLSSNWCPSENDIGTYSFALRVTDDEGTSVVRTFTLEVQKNPNHRPVIESWTPGQSGIRIEPGATQSFSVSVADEDGDVLSYGWSLYDINWSWITNGNSTSSSWVFDTALISEGRYIVEVAVSDGIFWEYRSWTVDVAEKTPLAITTGSTLPVALTDESYWQPIEASGGEWPYTWEIVDPDNVPEWLYVSEGGEDNESYLSNNWRPSEDDIGTYSFALRVTDGEGTSVVRTFTLEVQENPNPPPVIDSWSPSNARVRVEPGQSQTFSVTAHDPKGDTIHFYWYVRDPEGNRLYRSESGGESNEFSWTFDSTTTGTYDVSVEVSDGSYSCYSEWNVTVDYPKTIYVDCASTVADPDGTSWETAYPTLEEASYVAGAGDTVLVAPGTYAEEGVYFQTGVTLRSRDGAATTILDGEGSHPCALFSYSGEDGILFSLDGFTLRNGSNGGDWYPAAVQTGTRLENCVIENCVGTKWQGILEGGELVNCVVRNCRVTDRAYDGIIVNCDLVNCAIVGNVCDDDWDESSTVYNCRLWNCTVAGNTVGFCAAVNDNCAAWNCILWDNFQADGYQESIECGAGGWDDSSGQYTRYYMPAITNCCVAGLAAEEDWLRDEGFNVDFSAQGCFEANPKFVDGANGDFRLRVGSPCVDVGAAAFVRSETDVAGNARVQGAAVDLGAYEGAMDGFVVSVRADGAGVVSPMSALVTAGGSATFTATGSGGRPFLGWTTNGVNAGSAATLTLSNIGADCELVARFGAFVFHVDAATGDDANDGRSWSSPMATIQTAIAAAFDGETVSVKPGVYEPINTAGKAIRIESTDGLAMTMIDGGGTNRCAYLGTGAGRGSTLSGFTLRNGNASWDCTPKAGLGGGAYGGTLLDCDVVGNRAYEEGGGLGYSEAHRCRIVGNSIDDGDEYAFGGGAGDSDLYCCLVASNRISLAISPSFPHSRTTVLGGGVAWCALCQCTVVDNFVEVTGDTSRITDLEIQGGGFYGSSVGAGNILYGNTAGGEPSDAEDWDGPSNPDGSLIGVDPLFVDRAHGNYRLQESSPAVDVGSTAVDAWKGASTSDTDLGGNPRIRGNSIDLGCYESAWSVGRTETVTTPEAVEYSWLSREAAPILANSGGNYEVAAAAMASNGVNKVWECYVAGLTPTNAEARFEATITIGADGKPDIAYNPPLSAEETAKREYIILGKRSLDLAEEWTNVTDVPDLDEAGWRFFKVKVRMKK